MMMAQGILGSLWKPFLSFAVILMSLTFSLAAQTGNAIAEANSIINNATAYVNTVNQSGYLIFYPNLTKAYSYLNKSEQVYKSDPNAAVRDANLAMDSAKSQYERISAYRSTSFIVMAIATVVSFVLVYVTMKPKRN